ncbi:MAG TPA: toll/interleukin-1 receptor domain-containing protein [Thermoanaerobaculia bacterium]
MSPRPVKPPERSANIFINYRREDSAGHAGRLFDRLSSHFPGRLFMDVDTIAPGVDFGDAIEQAVGSCEVLIVIIGQQWLTIKNASGTRRLDDSGDFVRLEVEAALARNIRIIPVLVQDAPMPRAEDLPPSLARLARRNAIEISDARWGYDVDRLAHTIREVLGEETAAAQDPREPRAAVAEKRPSEPRTWLRASMFLLTALVLVSAGWISRTRIQSPTGETTGGRVNPAPAQTASSSTPAPASANPAPAPAVSNPAPAPAVSSSAPALSPSNPAPAPAAPRLPPTKRDAYIKPAEPEPSRTPVDSRQASDETLPGVTIVSPRDGEKVGKCVKVRGVLSGLGSGQRAFLCIKNRESTIYPRGELFPNPDGQWSFEAVSSHHDFETFVVISTSSEAAEVLSDRNTREHGLRLLPKEASITGPVVSMKRQGKVADLIKSKCGNSGP